MNKTSYWTGTLGYLILLIFSIHFYLERTAFIDIAFHLFYIIKDDSFAIQNFRFGAFFTQLFPLLASKLSLDISTISKLYSMAFVIFYFLCYHFSWRISNNWKFGITMFLISFLMVTDTFYWIQSELPQGIGILVVYTALLHTMSRQQETHWTYITSTNLMLFALVFIHPLIMFPYVFSMVFFLIDKQISKKLFLSQFMSYIALSTIKKLFFNTSYDLEALGKISNFIELFPNYLHLESNQLFIHDLYGKFIFLSLGLLVVLFGYIVQKNWLKLTWTTLSFLGYVFIINVCYPHNVQPFYMENLYLPLSVFVSIPLVFDILKIKHFKIWFLLFLAMITIRVSQIYSCHQTYTDRLSYLDSILQENKATKKRKKIVSLESVDKDKLMMTWASCYEFWLLSTIRFNDTHSILISKNPEELVWAKEKNKVFITNWGIFDYSQLNEKYFVFSDSSHYEYPLQNYRLNK